ncbi:TRAP transporter large permease [Kordiimonas laminariae]|uniref:TRAP transporter large permease n=1 Tax=Kordiimonas laminariae TaxID=2917717 RepID=UPI001FF2B74F|nr:TRAP transporter large permease subunit [Kordiimonas laminariae]MCK0070511.1 TRAP transporter large permease subunit [Kordiimonas laminariae]
MEAFIEFLPFLMFLVLMPLLFSGFPVAFVLGGVGLGFWLLAVALGIENSNSFFLVVSRIFGGVVSKLVLVAIPMFIFMGTMLERSGVAKDLLHTLQLMTRRVPGGLALSVTILGVILAATTGIIGASVVMMTLLALPVMLERGYHSPLATGTIAASGTLGILLPPSIMLVVMADLLSTSAGSLFMAAIGPSLLLALLYLLYIFITTWRNPSLAPPLEITENTEQLSIMMVIRSFAPPVLLIVAVLGSIFGGFATPTEASGVGALGALLLAAFKGKLNISMLQDVLERSALTTAMLFGLFVGATAFSYVFALLGGHEAIIHLMESTGTGPWAILTLLMIVVFILGFFFDWIEITLIILPVFAPVIAKLDFGAHLFDPSLTVHWFAILMAVNLQTSFLTPPFGFALFYMKGAAPKSVKLAHIYKGIVPFVLLQLLGLVLLLIWPEIALWLPSASK